MLNDQGGDVSSASSSHVTDELLSAFLDGRLSDEERHGAIAHFADCESCRADLVDARKDLTATRNRSVWSRVRWPALAAAVLLVAFLPVSLIPGRGRSGRAPDQAVRGASPEGGTAIAVIGPADRDTVPVGSVRFVWHPAGSDAVYKVLLLDAAGTVRWSTDTEDTVAVLPDSAGIVSGAEYFWSVDALLAGGRSARTSVHGFVVR